MTSYYEYFSEGDISHLMGVEEISIDAQAYASLLRGDGQEGRQVLQLQIMPDAVRPGAVRPETSDVKKTVKSEDIIGISGYVIKDPVVIKEEMAGILPDTIYTPQFTVLGGSLLTNEESDLLIQQLEHLPPEAINQAGDVAKCKVCSSIIYRPVIKPENL
jgi:hypothetical protein